MTSLPSIEPDSGTMDPFGPLLEKTRVPQPSLQRLAVISIFSKIRSADSTRSSEHESHVISYCLLAASPAVVDQSVRELCRLAADSLRDVSTCLLELQSSLEGSDPKFASLFVKGIGFVVRLGFKERKMDWRFVSAESHPFVRVLVCRAEGGDELVRQVLLFIVKNKQLGMARVCEFLRPFLNYSILRIPFTDPSSSLLVTSLLASMASLSCSLLDDVVPLFRLLTGCLRIFPLKNADDFKNLLNFVERIVEAHMLVLRQLSGNRQVINEVQRCSIEMLETMLDFCGCPLKYSGVKVAFMELSKRLLLVPMDLNLDYIPEVSAVTLTLFSLLTQSTLEHEQIPILELALHIFKWKANAESLLDSPARVFGVELLFIFPVISLISSPSKSIKGAASELILMLEKMIVKLLVGLKTDLGAEEEIPSASGPGKIVFRLLQHLWLQDLVATSIFSVDIFAFTGTNTLKLAPTASVSWMHRLMEHSSCIVSRKKSSLPGTEAQGHVSAEMPMLICSVANVLVTHPTMGPAAVDVLTAMGVVDPTAGVTLLLAVLFFNGLYNKKDIMGGELMLKVLGMLPQLASHSSMIPLIIQTLTPLLNTSRPVLYATATRLLCQTWAISDRAFVRLQGILAPEHFKDGSLEKSVCLSIAASIQDVCQKNPDRGVDLILSISACIETQDSLIQALGFQSLAYLCEADVVDFYTAWDVVEKQMVDYSDDPFLARSVSLLLRWGAMDAEAYQEASRHVVQILWDIGTTTHLDKKMEWSKARASAWNALVQYEIPHILGAISEMKERSICLLISERDDKVLGAMEQLLVKIILYEHMNRRRLLKEKNTATNKIEKLLDVLPQVIFSSGKKVMKNLPGAALICYSLSPKDYNSQGTTTVANDQYEETFIEIAASFQLSRNILLALLSLQSWKSFMRKWISAKALSFEERASIQVLDRTSKAANAIMKSVIRIAEASLPRSAENIALAIGALCAVLPPSVHTVKSAASKFLLGWLSQSEHEHRQWSAAISLGAISSCLHVTDCKQKVLNISGLIEVLSNSKSALVKGACGIGLGFSSQDLLPKAMAAHIDFNRETSKLQDMVLIGDIIRSLSSVLLNVTRSSSKILHILSEYIPPDLRDGGGLFTSASYCEDLDLMEEDVWGVAGLVIGLGSSISAVYRCGDVDTVLRMKELIISLVPFHPSAEKSSSNSEGSEMLLYAGSCLALPLIVDFCQRVELIDATDVEVLLNGYRNILSELFSVQKTGSFHQSLLMASCVGSGSLLAFLANEDPHHIEVDSIIKFLELFRRCYTSPHPPAICLGGMLGVVNSLGAEAGVWLDGTDSLLHPHSTVYQKESSSVMRTLLSHPVCESSLISIVQEMFLIAQNPDDEQLRNYATWTLSLLRRMWSEEDLTPNYSAENARGGLKVASQSFSTDSVVMKLSLWLMNLPKVTSATVEKDEVEHVKTIGTVLKCLSQAPRLPDMDWGAIVRRCMRLDIQGSRILPSDLAPQKGMLREEALRFALSHACHSDHLLGFLDDLTDLARFRSLELNLQSYLLLHLPDLLKSFSRSRLEKLFFDMNDFLGSMSRDNHSPPDRRRLLISTWKGLHQCFDETSPDLKENLPNFERLVEVIFSLLPESWLRTAEETDNPSCAEEWSVAVKCLEKAPMDWLLNFLQVDLAQLSDRFNENLKKIVMKAKLVRTAALPLTELVKLKTILLNFPSREIWQVLIEVVAALQHAEVNVKRQWLAEATEISCVSKYPTTAVGFVSMLSGSCCKYMPILMLDQRSVLCDLPVTIISLLALPTWTIIAERVATSLFASSERIYSWVTRSTQNEVNSSGQHDDIDESETGWAPFLFRVLHASCILLRDYLPLDKQIRLANMVVS